MSLVFNGAQHATSTTASHILGTGAWTTMAWVKVFSTGATATMSIISEQDTGRRQGLDIRYVNGTIVVERGTYFMVLLLIPSYRSTTISSTSPISLNEYHHIAVSWSGTTLTLYVDGVQQSTANTPSGDQIVGSSSNTWGARKTANATWDQYFQGEILDYRKYTVALPADIISTIATCSGLDFITQNLAYRYFMFGVAGTNATQVDDWSNNNFDRSITSILPFG